jgi:hypothetical protein
MRAPSPTPPSFVVAAPHSLMLLRHSFLQGFEGRPVACNVMSFARCRAISAGGLIVRQPA